MGDHGRSRRREDGRRLHVDQRPHARPALRPGSAPAPGDHRRSDARRRHRVLDRGPVRSEGAQPGRRGQDDPRSDLRPLAERVEGTPPRRIVARRRREVPCRREHMRLRLRGTRSDPLPARRMGARRPRLSSRAEAADRVRHDAPGPATRRPARPGGEARRLRHRPRPRHHVRQPVSSPMRGRPGSKSGTPGPVSGGRRSTASCSTTSSAPSGTSG